jgi:glycosyltransferase involved in cell wall biosynthesis
MKNVSSYLFRELSSSCVISNFDVKKIHCLSFWREIKKYNPDIIHFITGPGISSFALLKILKLYTKSSKTIMSSIHYNRHFCLIKKPIKLLKPDLILAQSGNYHKFFKELGCNTKLLPNGVDIKRFIPASKEEKEMLRRKYAISLQKFIILHVGHITKFRGLDILCQMQRENDNQVIIAASTYFRSDKKLRNTLKKNGCIVWSGYFKNIEEIYAMADCYIFPVRKGNSILMPLSVMEAMSCNLPVITAKFDALAELFSEGEGLIFAESEKEFLTSLNKIKNRNFVVKTREKICKYSWENVKKELMQIYDAIYDGD